MREDHSPRRATVRYKERQEERGLRAVRIGQMKAEPEKGEAKEDPHETQQGEKADPTTGAGVGGGGTQSAT